MASYNLAGKHATHADTQFPQASTTSTHTYKDSMWEDK
jgi:hypothetical protein